MNTGNCIQNVVLLSVDALRADHLSYTGYPEKTSPELDNLVNNGSVFRNAYSASSHTRESVPSLITGSYPDLFVRNGFTLAMKSIAGRLSDSGFSTAAFHSNPYISRAYEFDSGFDRFYDDLRFGQNKILALLQRALDKFVFNRGQYHARAPRINSLSLDWIDSLPEGQQFFLWNHYMDVHGPYNPPEGYGNSMMSSSEAQRLYQKCVKKPDSITDKEHEILQDLYDGEISYLDKYIGEILDLFEDRGLLDKTLVIITSDHGDAFGEHGYYGHPRYLHDELLHVPLIFIGPRGIVKKESFSTPVSSLDIVPTILDSLGIEDSSLPGKSLISGSAATLSTENHPGIVFSSVQREDDRSHLRRFSIRNDKWKYSLTRDIKSCDILDEHLYNLEVDPKEQEPIKGGQYPEETTHLRSSLLSHSKIRCNNFEENKSFGSEELDVNEEIEERLESLGYK